MVTQGKDKGRCEVCGKDPRVLTAIDSGQWVCRTCLRELRPSEPKTKQPRAIRDRARKSPPKGGGLEVVRRMNEAP